MVGGDIVSMVTKRDILILIFFIVTSWTYGFLFSGDELDIVGALYAIGLPSSGVLAIMYIYSKKLERASKALLLMSLIAMTVGLVQLWRAISIYRELGAVYLNIENAVKGTIAAVTGNYPKMDEVYWGTEWIILKFAAMFLGLPLVYGVFLFFPILLLPKNSILRKISLLFAFTFGLILQGYLIFVSKIAETADMLPFYLSLILITSWEVPLIFEKVKRLNKPEILAGITLLYLGVFGLYYLYYSALTGDIGWAPNEYIPISFSGYITGLFLPYQAFLLSNYIQKKVPTNKLAVLLSLPALIQIFLIAIIAIYDGVEVDIPFWYEMLLSPYLIPIAFPFLSEELRTIFEFEVEKPKLIYGPSIDALRELYERVEYIGEGGFAYVFKAIRKRDGKTVAVKIPKTLNPAMGRMFIKEVGNWLHLIHPNIVRLYEVNIIPVPYIEMEYCEDSLEREKKPMEAEKAAWLVFNAAEGLKYAHSKRILHRDLKPSNILLKNGIPKISDWGLSKFIGEESTTTMAFTPYYASPEQIAPETFGEVDERSDIWQLGVVFYELLTGKRPFDGGSLSSLAQAITTKEPPRPSELNPDARPFDNIVLKMLAKRKEERYGSVEELQRDLAKILGISYQRKLERSVSSKDFSRSAFYAGELALMHLKLGNYKDALKYLNDLKVYSKSRELDGLIKQVELAMEEGVKLGEDFLAHAEVLIHEIKMGR
jgi:serine/threonine protein kinase